ncbi:MAG: hypothetical protein J0M18_20255 [Ignavibacteria bacterium]|nr:hypothetical protein [Ignavibacteria bacterium]
MESQKSRIWSNVFPVCIVVFLLAGIYSCNNSDVVNTGSISTMNDDNILRTDATGRILEGDFTDWCFRDSLTRRSFGPAYPNPANDSISLNFSVPEKDTLSLYFYDGNDSLFVFKNNVLFPGYYNVNFKGSTFGFFNTYKRIYMRNKRGLFSASTNCNNFGDIHFR